VLLRSNPITAMTRAVHESKGMIVFPPARGAHLRVGMDDLLEEVLDARLVVMGLFFLWGFGLGPGSDIPRASPSRGEELCLWLGTVNVRFGLIPHFAQGPVTNISNPASSGGDSLMLGMSDVDGWLDVRGSEIGDVGISTPSRRMLNGVFRNGVNAVSGQDTVSTPSSFQADLAVFRLTRGR